MNRAHLLIEYVPPKAETIQRFAQTVCELMAERTQDPVFTEPHVIRGLSEFLQLAARAQAQVMSARELIDKDEKRDYAQGK